MAFCNHCGKQLSVGATKCEACGASVGGAPQSGGSPDQDSLSTRIANQGAGQDFSTIPGQTPAAPAIGAQIGRILGGRYQLDQCIGSGGMGEIYRARRLHIGDTVAVKVLRPDVVENEKSRQRFYREARAAAMLHHPNAVVIHDFGEDNDGTAYIVMELLVGRSLRQLLVDEGSISPIRAHGIIRQASAALDAGHRNGIVHRDIKPDNIILLDSHDDADHIKILDFGIAKLRDKALDTASLEQRLTNVGTVIGTPHYMSPEQCQGEEADARSDIYSLGVVLYELLTGVVPFVAKTPTGIAIKHVTEPPRPLREINPNLTPAVERAVLHALEKDPSTRPQTALELARELEAAIRDEPDTARFLRSGEQPEVDKAGLGKESSTEILPSGSGAGSRPESIRPESGSLPQSYDTMVTPPKGTDQFQSPLTTEQQAGTADLKMSGMPETELLSKSKQTEPIRDSKAAGTEVLKEAQTDKLRTNPTPEAAQANKPPKSKKPKAAEPAQPAKTMPPPPSMPAAAAKSRMPLIATAGAILLIIAAAGAWLLRSDGSQVDNATGVQTAASSTPAADTQPSPSPTSAYPEVAAPEGMVYVLGGVLRVGRDDGEPNERPAHVVNIKPFFIDRTEVTNEQYLKFIEATGHPAPPSWKGGSFPEGAALLPVTDVTWEDALDFAKWTGKRLPTEEEWEFAARSAEGRVYPWGEDWIPDGANASATEGEKKQLSPVGQFPKGASPFGLLDMSGNAWEWTATDFVAYPGGKVDSPPAGYTNLKVIRGGSYESTPKFATTTWRRGWPANRKDWPNANQADYTRTGFRCAQDAKP